MGKIVFEIAVYLVAIITLTWGGNLFCRFVLHLSGVRAVPDQKADEQSPDPAAAAKAGRFIGSIERILILLGLAANSWEMLVAVIALKTVGRYQELDKQIRAEYFLLGSLASILWAVFVGLVLLLYDRTIGLHILESIFAAAPTELSVHLRP